MVIRWFSPRIFPDLVQRHTAHERVSSMLGGITGESWWKSKITPFSKAVFTGLICEARSQPKFSTCTSPQWYTWATKKEAIMESSRSFGT